MRREVCGDEKHRARKPQLRAVNVPREVGLVARSFPPTAPGKRSYVARGGAPSGTARAGPSGKRDATAPAEHAGSCSSASRSGTWPGYSYLSDSGFVRVGLEARPRLEEG